MAVRWCAFAGTPKEKVFTRLGLVDSGRTVAFEPESTRPAYAEMSSGWLVIAGFWSFESLDVFEELSADGQTVLCCFDQTCSFSTAQGFQRGQGMWSVIHDEEGQAPYDLDAAGILPDSFGVIVDRLMAEQAIAIRDGSPADMLYLAPMELAFELCGFRAEIGAEGAPTTMTRLENAFPSERRRRMGQSWASMFRWR